MSLELVRTGNTRWQLGLVNGPNMPNLVHRDPRLFGPAQSIHDLERRVFRHANELGVDMHAMHSNHDGVILDWLHEVAFDGRLDGLIINPGDAVTYCEHFRHCLEDSGLPYVEVHFFNLVANGITSRLTRTAAGLCHGLRKHSYTAALIGLVRMLDDGDFIRPLNYHRHQERVAERNGAQR